MLGGMRHVCMKSCSTVYRTISTREYWDITFSIASSLIPWLCPHGYYKRGTKCTHFPPRFNLVPMHNNKANITRSLTHSGISTRMLRKSVMKFTNTWRAKPPGDLICLLLALPPLACCNKLDAILSLLWRGLCVPRCVVMVSSAALQWDFDICWLTHLPLWSNGCHFSLRCIFVNENLCISTKISLKFVPKGPIDNILALVEIMAWRQIGDKPLSEPMLTRPIDAYMWH